jgi:predicted ATPase
MLRKFYVHNFKTLLEFTLEPRGMNLVIGANNAGKTSLRQAMEFLSLTARDDLGESARQATGTMLGLTNRYAEETIAEFRCECELALDVGTCVFEYELAVDFGPAAGPSKGPALVREALRVAGGGFHGDLFILNQGGTFHALEENAALAGKHVIRTGIATADMTFLRQLVADTPATHRAFQFKSYLLSWIFYDLDNGQLRRTTSRPADRRLDRDGGNLASVVSGLKGRSDRAYRNLVGLVRTVEPDLQAILFEPSPDPKQAFMVFEHSGHVSFRHWELSNGTLRMLALGSIIESTACDVSAACGSPPVVMIEEPETGVYVGCLRRLFDAVDPSGAAGQYIFTSHSPYFIDLFDGNLESVFLLKREGTRAVLVRPDPGQVRELIEQEFSLGELHFREMLG